MAQVILAYDILHVQGIPNPLLRVGEEIVTNSLQKPCWGSSMINKAMP